jgi:hypothetical protein
MLTKEISEVEKEIRNIDFGKRVFKINIFNYTLELKRWKR